MSFAGAQWIMTRDVAEFEIHKRTVSIFWNLRWKYWLKTSVTVKWPSGWAQLSDSGEEHAESSNPNTWYRWWLEKYVGKQGKDWDWKIVIGATTHVIGYEHLYGDFLEVKFRNPAHASLFAMRWA